MTSFWALYHHHITCELIPAVLVTLALVVAWWHDKATNIRKRIRYRLNVIVLVSLACGLASRHPFSPSAAMIPLAVFGAAIILDSVVYVLTTPEWTLPDAPPAEGEQAETKEGALQAPSVTLAGNAADWRCCN